jgi:hypothetical protein
LPVKNIQLLMGKLKYRPNNGINIATQLLDTYTFSLLRSKLNSRPHTKSCAHLHDSCTSVHTSINYHNLKTKQRFKPAVKARPQQAQLEAPSVSKLQQEACTAWPRSGVGLCAIDAAANTASSCICTGNALACLAMPHARHLTKPDVHKTRPNCQSQ